MTAAIIEFLSGSDWNDVPFIVIGMAFHACQDAGMKTVPPRTERRADALSKQRIVEAAIEILDADGETALTFRALAARLATGSGAIYWHVADKGELLAAATDEIVARVMTGIVPEAEPRAAIRAIALGVFDAIDAHPWVGAQLTREPWRPALLLVFEGIGGRLQTLGVPERAQFDAASTLLSYVIGVGGQNAAHARMARDEERTDRSAFLGEVADRWSALPAPGYPFLRHVAAQMRDHDDREQFLAGVDLIMAGIAAIQ
ncbi:TetR/AcrR family transcriptional regulator [Kaistia sp. MMO-174]|uniref:TetR/AcrR family transcriptional regulator n=1 Tax=Kaistia sp. MMO-174 TaxID=3081256 RepID=UPI003018DC42